MFEDVGEPLSESIKILNFKGGIRPEAGLESALDVARGLQNVNNNFDNFSNHITEGVTNRRSRREMFRTSSNTREVSAYGRGGRGRGGGRVRGRGRSGRGSGRGRGRGRHNNRRATSVPEKINIEGKDLFPSKTYSAEEYNELSYNQRNELRKARLRNSSTAFDTRSINAAVTEGIREALNANEESNANIDSQQEVPAHIEGSVNVSSNASTSTDQFRKRRRG